MLIPVTYGGVLVLGEHTITHLSGVDFKSVPVPFSMFKAHGKIDNGRYLLADSNGLLSVLVLRIEGGAVAGLQVRCRQRVPTA
eukprot:829264-Prymnesium_polylepis.1